MKKKRINWRLPVAAFALGLVACMGAAPVKAEGEVTINETNFPDVNFRHWVTQKEKSYGNGDGVFSQEEISDVTYLYIYSSYEDENDKEVELPKVTSLQGIEYFTELTSLYIYSDAGDLTSLDLSKNVKLRNVSGLYYCENLTSLNLSGNTVMTSVPSTGDALTSLNVSGMTALTSLDCSGKSLTSLNVSGATALTSLDCSSNDLTSLDVSTNTGLVTLDCSKNDLTALNVSALTALETLTCTNNDLTSLDVSKNTKLETLDCSGNDLTTLTVNGAAALETLTCTNNDLQNLDVSGNTELTSLYCGKNKLEALNVSANTKLQYLYCYDNQLTSLDVSANTKLQKLYCYDNQLTSLDLEKNKKIVSVSAYCEYPIQAEDDGTYDLTQLGNGFNVDKADEWDGGTVKNNILTLDEIDGEATYAYDCGNDQTVYFTLKNLHNHKGTLVPGKSATCVTDGEKSYYVCACGAKFEDEACTNRIRNLDTWKVIRATGVHTKVTSTVDGKQKVVCAVCGQIMTGMKTVSSVTLSKTSYTYDGKAKKPSVKALNEDGKKISSKYYTVKYAKGRKNVGTYTVKVTFKGKYTGSETLSFTINPKKTSISKVTAGKKKLTVKWKKVSKQATGYEIQYSTDKSFTSSKTVTIKKSKTTSKALSKLTAKKKYYVRIRTYKTVKKVKYYSAWSKVKSATTK